MAAQELVVDAAHHGERLDRFLQKSIPGANPERIAAWLAQGAIRIRGKVPKPLRRLYAGDVVTFAKPEPARADLPGSDAKLPVLHESAAVVAIDKPAGLNVEPEGKLPSVVGALATQLQGWDVLGKAQPGVVHRLDKQTSGCLLLAKTDAAVAALKAAFDEGAIEKIYLAIVIGQPAPEGKLDTAYARDPKDPRRYTTLARSARRARLAWKTLASHDGAALLQIHLDTGRTHQIRVQLAESGLPVLGDAIYGPRETREHPASPGRHALHAWKLAFPDPASGQRVGVEAPLPDDLRNVLTRMGLG
ncbi:MAG: RluA family pseudouridine synthase [Deltaproteobacteria bacterium]|nr:RluA family pseudouridine synthase [Deltaproteobacteria bacterium]